MNIGDRVCLDLTVMDIVPVMGAFRDEERYRLKSEDGSVFIWRYTGDYRMDIGRRYRIKATVVGRDSEGRWRLKRGRFGLLPEDPAPGSGPSPDGR